MKHDDAYCTVGIKMQIDRHCHFDSRRIWLEGGVVFTDERL